MYRNGATPLTDRLLEIGQRIEEMEHDLRSNGQRAVVILATDGLPSSSSLSLSSGIYNNNNNVDVNQQQQQQQQKVCNDEFVTAIKKLQQLPIWMVIRLCTDEKNVVEYYNNLDEILELQLVRFLFIILYYIYLLLLLYMFTF